jgi:hypothetical protein
VSMFLDIHDLPGVSAGAAAGAAAVDFRLQAAHGLDSRHFWADEAAGRVFCLLNAPDREAANRVHRESHGLVANILYEVGQGA